MFRRPEGRENFLPKVRYQSQVPDTFRKVNT